MQTITLHSKERRLRGKKLRLGRAQGVVPGVVYGQGKTTAVIEVDAKELDKIYHEAGTSRLIELKVDDKAPVNVLFHDVQVSPLSQKINHFDLYTVKMDEKIKTEVPIHFTGEAPAVHSLNAILVKNLEEIEIETLPGNLPEKFEVDLGSLEEIGQSISVSDLQMPEGVTLLTDTDEMIVKTDPPRSEEELEELDEAVEEGAEAEVASEHGGDESEEGAEGATDDAQTGDTDKANTEDTSKEAKSEK